MGRDSTSYAAQAARASEPGAVSFGSGMALAQLALAFLAGAFLVALAYQLPVTHIIDFGGYDAAYVQGMGEPLSAIPALAGSDGSARLWDAQGALLLPQAGLPATLILHARSPDEAPHDVVILLNSAQELGRFAVGPQWEAHSVAINRGLLKPNDVVIQLRGPEPGVLVDYAEFRAGPPPILPYPPQLLYGALAAGLLWVLVHGPQVLVPRPALLWLAGVLLITLAFLLLYRMQLLYPYPLLRLLPALDALLVALCALRFAPAVVHRAPALPDALALTAIGGWAVALLMANRAHVTLSVPGAENDFRVFALRSAHLVGAFPAGIDDAARDGVLRADGFYNLGYPFLLWLVRPFTSDNPFLAARMIATLSGVLLLLAGWLLARRLLGRGVALLAVLLLALSPLAVQYSLYLGTDMPFAALCALVLALLVPQAQVRATADAAHNSSLWQLAAAGLVAGAAFLVRHPGLLLLPFGWLVIWSAALADGKRQALLLPLLAFTLAFLLAITPQLAVNLRDTGTPLYSQQAKNVWQGMFGNGDWNRWAGARNDIGIAEVIALDPGRFLVNWWNNLRGFVGTGGEDLREFGQALQLRLLGFPANWLAVGGLLGWLWLAGKQAKAQGFAALRAPGPYSWLMLWAGLYVAAISVGLPLQGRFVLPLLPVYAVAAAWLALRLTGPVHLLLAGLVLLALLWGGFGLGTSYVLRAQPTTTTPGQPADELAIIQSVQARLLPDERIIVRADPRVPLGKYSAIAHLVQPAPAADTPAALRASGATYLIWSTSLGPAPALGSPLEVAGNYELYSLQ
ncbi:MAG: glycosyltransferase family 39 protein [Chloroflexi bacterium SZAS-1]|nr:glycosyltransferase family 39 protein [Chloroflexi bacterium SZAS-1]